MPQQKGNLNYSEVVNLILCRSNVFLLAQILFWESTFKYALVARSEHIFLYL